MDMKAALLNLALFAAGLIVGAFKKKKKKK